MRIGIKEVTNPLEVLECLVAFDSRDYGTAKRDRMLYAIILGWDDASYKSFGWSEEEIKEWKQMRERFERLKEVDICTADVVPKSELEISQHLLKDAWKRIEELDALCGELQRKYDLAVAEREANVKGFTEELEKANADIERLKYNLKAVLDEIPETKRELASEIFEEIETALKLYKRYDLKSGTYFECYLESDIAELKKKYTED